MDGIWTFFFNSDDRCIFICKLPPSSCITQDQASFFLYSRVKILKRRKKVALFLENIFFFSLLSYLKTPDTCARHLITNMHIYLHSVWECQVRKGPHYIPLLIERLKMLHLALYEELPALAIANSYSKNSYLLEL